jgi:hypothetical protein
MKLLSRMLGQRSAPLPSWAALDEEALRLGSALEHIERRGNLDEFPATAKEKLALLTTANRRGLVQWNRSDSRYELTSLGRRLGIKSTPREPESRPTAVPGTPVDRWRGFAFSPRALVAAAVGMALGAAAIVLTLDSHNLGRQGGNPIPAADKTPAPGQQSVTAQTPPNQTNHGPPQSSASENIPAPPAAPNPSAAQLSNTPPSAPDVSNAEQAASASPPESIQPAVGRAATNAASQTPQTHTAGSEPDRELQPHSAGSGSPGMAAGSETKSTGEPAARPKTRERTSQAATRPVRAATARHQTAKARPSKSAAPGPQQAWSSAKTVNVSRTGALVREERRMSDGSVLVRYQYGTGPAHFEKRPGRDGDRATGHASGQTRFSRAGRFEWLFR